MKVKNLHYRTDFYLSKDILSDTRKWICRPTFCSPTSPLLFFLELNPFLLKISFYLSSPIPTQLLKVALTRYRSIRGLHL